MKTNHLSIVLTLLVILLIGCGAKAVPVTVPANARAGDLVGLSKCEYQFPDSNTKSLAECGMLIVPENWDKANARLIALPVVRIRATGSNPGEPVFFLNGGPGGPNIVWTPLAAILQNHDVVEVGYRGVEGSVKLDCPETFGAVNAHKGKDLFSAPSRNEFIAAAKQCVTRLQKEGIDLAGYTILGVAQDMEAASKALGYPRINLLAASYGTRVAQIYAYLHPNNLRRMALLGVNTPGRFIWTPSDFDKMLAHISELCAKDPSCNSRTKNLARTMYEVNRNMPKQWLFLDIDPDSIRFVTQFMFFNNPNMTPVFDAYLAVGEGDASGLALMNLMVKLLPVDAVFGDQFNKGATVDGDKYRGIESVSLGNSVMGAPLSESIWPAMQEWRVEMIPQKLREFQETDVEMLLVNGTVDFSTPPSALDEVKPYFHKTQVVSLPEFSHVGDVQRLQPAAFERLIASYFDTGVGDASLFVYQPLSFKPSFSFTLAAKLLVAAMIVLPVLLIGIVVLVVRRVRRRRTVGTEQKNPRRET